MIAMKWWKSLFLLFLLGTASKDLNAQEVKVRAGFVKDSIRVGDEVLFFVTARYLESAQVVFPDSSFSFTPFELKRKDYFPTRTKDSLSYDSAVYALRTFEVTPELSLRLPVFIINNIDCTRVFSNRDTISLSVLVDSLPDSLTADLPLKATTGYQHVPLELNTPLIIIALSFVAISAGVGWVVFGPAIRKHYRIRRLKKMHEEFSDSFNRDVLAIQSAFSRTITEAAVIEWKKYMEQISRRPFTKLTSRETALMEKDEMLGKNLKLVDTAIYGSNTSVLESLQSLKSYADKRFETIISEVKNG
jgi:hypothetical protein